MKQFFDTLYGEVWLTTESSQSAYGLPVLLHNGTVFGPDDLTPAAPRDDLTPDAPVVYARWRDVMLSVQKHDDTLSDDDKNAIAAFVSQSSALV